MARTSTDRTRFPKPTVKYPFTRLNRSQPLEPEQANVLFRTQSWELAQQLVDAVLAESSGTVYLAFYNAGNSTYTLYSCYHITSAQEVYLIGYMTGWAAALKHSSSEA